MGELDFRSERTMAGWIDAAKPMAEHGYRRSCSAALQRPAMRRTIDACRQPGYNDQAVICQHASHLPCQFPAASGTSPCTDNRHCRGAKTFDTTSIVENDGRIRNLPKETRNGKPVTEPSNIFRLEIRILPDSVRRHTGECFHHPPGAKPISQVAAEVSTLQALCQFQQGVVFQLDLGHSEMTLSMPPDRRVQNR
jgi:hypothetical protein